MFTFRNVSNVCRFKVSLIIVFATLAPLGSLWAQDAGGENAASPSLDFLQQEIVQDLETAARVNLMFRVKIMTDLFDLSTKETETLAIAAKGAASRYASDFGDKIKLNLGDFSDILPGVVTINGREVRIPENDKPIEDALAILSIEITINDEDVWLRLQSIDSTSGNGQDGGLKDLFDQAVWQTSVNKFLTPDQVKRLDRYYQDKIADVCTAQLLNYMELYLLLSEQQSEQVQEWIGLNFRKQAEIGQLRHRDAEEISMRHLGDEAVLQEILSELQWTYWSSLRRRLSSRF